MASFLVRPVCKRCHIIHRCISTSSDTTKSEVTKAFLDRVLRVDHAGELGANRIYQGQMAVLGKSSVGPVIEVCHTQNWPLRFALQPVVNGI